MKEIDQSYFQYDGKDTKSSIDEALTNDEQILWRGKPKKASYVWSHFTRLLPIAIVWLIFDGAFLGCLFGFGGVPKFVYYIIIPFFLIHLAPVWVWIGGTIRASIEHKNIEYAFTTKRIIVKTGAIGVDFRNIYYSDIVSVNVKVGIIDKMYKVGDVYIRTNNESVVLFDIEDYMVILKALQKIALDAKADIQFPNALRPEINKGYDTSYDDKEVKDILDSVHGKK